MGHRIGATNGCLKTGEQCYLQFLLQGALRRWSNKATLQLTPNRQCFRLRKQSFLIVHGSRHCPISVLVIGQDYIVN